MRHAPLIMVMLLLGVGGCQGRDTSQIRQLTAREAKKLVATHRGGKLNLDGLQTLDVDAAEELSQFDGEYLSLDGLKSLPLDLARTLHKFQCTGLGLNGLGFTVHLHTVLRPEEAEAITTFNGIVSLGKVTRINGNVARILTRFKGQGLYLKNVEELSGDAGRILSGARFGGLGLVLSGLKYCAADDLTVLRANPTISIPSAEPLRPDARFRITEHGNTFQVHGVDTLTSNDVAELREQIGIGSPVILCIDELTDLDPSVAEALLKLGNRGLSFRSLRSISADTAWALAQCNGELRLNGLQAISVDVADALASNRGPLLLDGIKSLTPELAERLGKHHNHDFDAPLSLNGLSELSTEAAQGLGKHYNLHLNGIRSISREVAEGLVRGNQFSSRERHLNGLKTLSPEVAKPLSGNGLGGDYLYLDGLRSLSPEAAQWLATTGNGLSLNGVESMSTSVAAALAKHGEGEDVEPRLSMNGIAAISAEAAEVLARHPGPVALNGIHELPDEVAQALAKRSEYFPSLFVDKIELEGLRSLSYKSKKLLRETPGIWLPREMRGY